MVTGFKKGADMTELFKTKRDINGNTYTLVIDHEDKTYKTSYNPFNYSDYITIGKRERYRMIKNLHDSGYTQID